METYYYFIQKNPIIAGAKKPDKLPKITKVKREKWPIGAYHTNRNEAEGPFNTLYDLKKRSSILAEIQLTKHRQRILKSSNITETHGYIWSNVEDSFTFDYMAAFAHITIGKITKSKVKGVHFFNPKTIRIINKNYIDPNNKCYSAQIEKLNEQTGQWIPKSTESTFFPDDWDLNRLFHEINFAFTNKVLIKGKIYHSWTTDNIKVEFIIDKDDKLLTCYPKLDI